MPITGNQKALMSARSGVARSGATRSNFFAPFSTVLTIGGTVRTGLMVESLSIMLAFNGEPSTARFTIRPSAGFIPTPGQEIIISFGSASNREFAGQITWVTKRRRVAADQSPFFEVQCIDWTDLFDRRLITAEYRAMSANAIAADIIDTYTSGFTRNRVFSDLPVIDVFPLTHERPSIALQRLANLISGGYFIDAFRDVNFYGSTGAPAGLALTQPTTLGNTLTGFHEFEHTQDISQIRTRMLVECGRTQVPVIAVPAGATTFPVGDDVLFDTTSTPANGGGLVYSRSGRIGTQRFTYFSISELNLIPGVNYPGSVVSTAAAIGATELEIDTVPPDDPVWAQVGEQVIFALDFDTGPNRLIQIPALGYGSITAPIEAGTQITWLPFVAGIPASGAGSIHVAQPEGTEVLAVLQVDQTVAQAARGSVEGGDGIHEYVIQDDRLTILGAANRARADLSAFMDVLASIRWTTDDLNAKPGRPQDVSFSAPSALTLTTTIHRVELSWPTPTFRPMRRCEAGTVKLSQWFQLKGGGVGIPLQPN